MFAITVYKKDDTGRRVDLARFLRADSAAEMEDAVTRFHREYPAPDFEVRVDRA